MWDVEYTDEFDQWWDTLDEDSQEAIVEAVERLQQRGPMLGRPLVDRIKKTRLQHLKELRPLGTTIRILFAFDPRRSAILLLGGDKAGLWNEWYRTAIPLAEALYEEHLRILREEGLL